MLKKLLVATAFAALPLAAGAADLPFKAAPMAAAAASWTGCYIGGTVGVALSKTTFGDPDEDITPDTQPGINAVGANAGATLGCNYQVGWAVLGIEGDWSWTNLDKTVGGYANSDPAETSKLNAHVDWFATARGRIGWVYQNLMVYGTGGVAFVKVNHKAQYLAGRSICGQPDGFWSCPTDVNTGLVGGVGIEVMLTRNWSVKGEYLYIAMPSIVTSDVNLPNVQYSWTDDIQVVRAGLNWRFGL